MVHRFKQSSKYPREITDDCQAKNDVLRMFVCELINSSTELSDEVYFTTSEVLLIAYDDHSVLICLKIHRTILTDIIIHT